MQKKYMSKYEKEITLTLGKPPSLNKFYAGKHWTVRKRLADDYKRSVKDALDTFDPLTISRFELRVSYNSRFDCDNSILCCKFVADCLVEKGYVADDTPKYYSKLVILYDPDLPKDTYKAMIKYYE
tara:strand:- start:38 stop:415 length:378 start_codon:yes stop_codon:yes gene_type:complete